MTCGRAVAPNRAPDTVIPDCDTAVGPVGIEMRCDAQCQFAASNVPIITLRAGALEHLWIVGTHAGVKVCPLGVRPPTKM